MVSSIYAFVCACTVSLAYSAPILNASSPVVSVKNGSYTGIHNTYYDQDFFLGIPYAQPPLNDLRFVVPQSLNTSWTGTHNSTAYPPFCVGYGGDDFGHETSEDCLYLSIVRPSNIPANTTLPVAVWIHGGGLFEGGSNDARYNLSYTVQNSVALGTPVIGISIQYRLSAWGFLAGKEVLESGNTNVGFRDQRLALHWVQENIAAFGGDKSKVTIWGESAGGQSVGVQLLAYNGRDDGLFSGAIAESGGPEAIWGSARFVGGYNSTGYQDLYNALVLNTSCASTLGTSSSFSCLQALPFSVLNNYLNLTQPSINPFIDNDLIVDYPSNQLALGNFVHVPLIIGTNTDEGTAFAPAIAVNTDAVFAAVLNNFTIPSASSTETLSYLYPDIQAIGIPNLITNPAIYNETNPLSAYEGLQYRRLAAYFGDATVIAPRRASSHAWSAQNVSSYAYRFDVTVNGVPAFIGSTHFQEVAFVFGNVDGLGYAASPFAFTDATSQEQAVALAGQMNSAWINFIATGDPNGKGLDTLWPVYDVNAGGGEGNNIVFGIGDEGVFVEADVFRAEGIAFINANALSVYGR